MNGKKLQWYFIDIFLYFIQAKDPPGLFALLDEESKFPQASDQTLIDKLVNNLGKKQPDLFQTPRGQGLQFMIKHFAGSVRIHLIEDLLTIHIYI